MKKLFLREPEARTQLGYLRFTLDWEMPGWSVFKEQGASSLQGSWGEACCWAPATVAPGKDDRQGQHSAWDSSQSNLLSQSVLSPPDAMCQPPGSLGVSSFKPGDILEQVQFIISNDGRRQGSQQLGTLLCCPSAWPGTAEDTEKPPLWRHTREAPGKVRPAGSSRGSTGWEAGTTPPRLKDRGA